MKSGAKKTDEPPLHSDLQGWKDVAAADGLRRLRPEDIIAAIQRTGPNGDQRLLSALIGHISEEIVRILKRTVSKNYKDHGEEIIWRTHHKLIVAALTPDSADGKGLCAAFRARVEFRVADAILAERKQNARYKPFATKQTTDDDGSPATETIEPADNKPGDYTEQAAHVEGLLSKISDPRKRQAFRLHMEGCQLAPGKGKTSIAQELGVSAKTAGEWIAEVQTLLKAEIGESND